MPKGKKNSIKNWIPIGISTLALIVSGVLGFNSNKIAKQALSPTLRLRHYTSEELKINESISFISNLLIVPSELYKSEKKNQTNEQEHYYLWLIIENKGNTADCLSLISIEYTFNKEVQKLSFTIAGADRRWPTLPRVMGSGEAFAILMNSYSDRHHSEGFKWFKVELNYSTEKNCEDTKDASSFVDTSIDLY